MATKKAIKRRNILIGSGISVGVLALALIFVVFGPGSKQTLIGSITVTDTNFYYGSSVVVSGGSCYTKGGYSDVNSGTDVVVRNGDGKVLAITQLLPGTPVGSYSCKFSYVLELSNSDFYAVHIGKRDDVNYTKLELEERNWILNLTLGD
jgi:hypothetical protein